MGDVTKLPLDAELFEITCTPGDDLNFGFEADVDMTGWNFSFKVYLANENGDGPTGSVLAGADLSNGSGITVTAGATSTIDIVLPGSVTSSQLNVKLWGILKRTDANSVRTFAKGQMLPI